jgi:hypothetical protein
MSDFSNQCFVCQKEIDTLTVMKNKQFNLPVCEECEGTNREQDAIAGLLEGMADGFVCGCI